MAAKHAKHARIDQQRPVKSQVSAFAHVETHASGATNQWESSVETHDQPTAAAGLLDVHCHILPGVDDGSRNLEESRAMLAEAARVGITSIVCTPHCRGSHFSQSKCVDAYKKLLPFAEDLRIHLVLAYEVYYNKLQEIGVDRAHLLRNPETDDLLLELPTGQIPMDIDRILFQLQSQGLRVIIAHPERYAYVQDDISFAQNWVERGCALQASANFIEGGMRSATKKAAKQMMQQGMYTYLASDAHEPDHYEVYRKCLGKYGEGLTGQ